MHTLQWSPDGTKILFLNSDTTGTGVDNPTGDSEIFTINADGTGLKQLTNDEAWQGSPTWSPDGAKIAFEGTGEEDHGPSLYTINVTEGTATLVAKDVRNGWAWSPDGTRIAYARYIYGHGEHIFTVRADGGTPTQISEGGGAFPDWQAIPDTDPDTIAPTVDIVTPRDGGGYVRNQTVSADYSCVDGARGSGLKSCEGTVAKGEPIDTGSLGTKTFTVKATDNAGNVRSVTHTYTVADCTITGTEGDDALKGTEGDDVICGMGGDDTMQALSGDDILDGGTGYDAASFEDSSQLVKASLIRGTATGEGNDELGDIEGLIGSPYMDILTGSESRDALKGMEGDDYLGGNGGADELLGEGGYDKLYGGPGDDSFIGGGTGSDRLYGEDGDDSLDSRDGESGNDLVYGGAGTNTCTTDTQDQAVNCHDVIEGDCTIVGTSNNDVLEGTSKRDVICGLSGDDVIKGLAGDDLIKGAAGYDTASFMNSSQGVEAHLRTDYSGNYFIDIGKATGEGKDTLVDIERLVGSRYPDKLHGSWLPYESYSDLNDALVGKAGNDFIMAFGGMTSYMAGKVTTPSRSCSHYKVLSRPFRARALPAKATTS